MADPIPLEPMPDDLDKLIRAKLLPGETVIVCLKGAYKEFLICTDRRLMIGKEGLMTGHAFGDDVFQLDYANIGSVKVEYGMLSGYFEVTAAGQEATAMSFWSGDDAHNPTKAPNCVSLDDGARAKIFKSACAVIEERVEMAKRAPAAAIPQADMADKLEKLWKLKSEGAITEGEYEAAKARVIVGQ